MKAMSLTRPTRLIKEGMLSHDGNLLKITQDFVFSSSSTAASVLLARSASGPGEWKDDKDRLLRFCSPSREGDGVRNIGHKWGLTAPGSQAPLGSERKRLRLGLLQLILAEIFQSRQRFQVFGSSVGLLAGDDVVQMANGKTLDFDVPISGF